VVHRGDVRDRGDARPVGAHRHIATNTTAKITVMTKHPIAPLFGLCQKDSSTFAGVVGIRGGSGVRNGRAHFGHAGAWSETSDPQSGHAMRGTDARVNG